MTVSVSYTRELLIALLVAIWAHVILFLFFVVLLFFESVAGEVMESSAEGEIVSEVTELNLIFEEEAVPLDAVSKQVVEPVAPNDRPKFAETVPDQNVAKPIRYDFIGENDSVATDDSSAGEESQNEVALSGEEEMKNVVQTQNSNFSDGEYRGEIKEARGLGLPGQGSDHSAKEERPEISQTEVKEEQLKKVQDFENLDEKDRKIEDQKDLAMVEQVESLPEPAITPESNETKKKEEVAQKQSGGNEGEYQTTQRKARILGSLNASGKGSLSVSDTPLGRYEAQISKEIDREWRVQNEQFRSHLASGFITMQFRLDQKGNVSGQHRIKMQGASEIQWAIVLRAVGSAKIPVMPKEVIEELKGEALELSVTFEY